MAQETGFKKIDHFAEGLEDLHAERGFQAWFTLSDIALQAALNDEGYMRRRRMVNDVLAFVGIEREEIPSKAPLAYRGGEAKASIAYLERRGAVESKTVSPDQYSVYKIYRVALPETPPHLVNDVANTSA